MLDRHSADGATSSSRRLRRGSIRNLTHALVVNQSDRAARSNMDSDSVPKYQRLGVVDLKSKTAGQLDRERPERRAALKSSEHAIEIIGGHI